KIDGVYSAPIMDAYPGMNSLTSDVLYGLFDGLVTNYPNYASKTLLGKDSSGTYDIYRYDFKAKEVPTDSENLKQKKPKMILISGIHGYERTHCYVMYQAFKQICENWQNDEYLETLRWNVDFIIIPAANPYALPGGLRTNANNVDLARNF